MNLRKYRTKRTNNENSYMIRIMMLQEHATLYEKLVFDVISYLMSEDRDDDVAVELHSKVSSD